MVKTVRRGNVNGFSTIIVYVSLDCNLFVEIYLKESVYKKCKCAQNIPSDDHDVFLDFFKNFQFVFNLFCENELVLFRRRS